MFARQHLRLCDVVLPGGGGGGGGGDLLLLVVVVMTVGVAAPCGNDNFLVFKEVVMVIDGVIPGGGSSGC